MQEGELRDRLALERTHLANERTLLAYVRTALALGAAGAALLQFFTESVGARLLAWLLVAAGVVALLAGVYRFIQVQRRIGGVAPAQGQQDGQ